VYSHPATPEVARLGEGSFPLRACEWLLTRVGLMVLLPMAAGGGEGRVAVRAPKGKPHCMLPHAVPLQFQRLCEGGAAFLASENFLARTAVDLIVFALFAPGDRGWDGMK